MSSFQSKFIKMVLAEVDAAILKAATPAEVVQEFATAEEARDNFRKLVLADLAERLGSSAAAESKPKQKKAKAESPAAPAPAAESPKEKKKRGPMTDEAKAAMKAKRDATVAAKKAGGSPADIPPAAYAAVLAEPAPAAESPKPKQKKAKAESPKPAAPAAAAVESPKEKKKRAPMTDEAKAAMKAKRDATLAAKAGGGAPNLAKVDPTWRKHLKTAAKAHGSEVTKEMEAALLAHLNSLTQEAFHAQKAEEHVVSFLAKPAGTNAAGGGAVVASQPTDLEVVEFEGKEFYVNADTKRVYTGEGEQDAEGGWTSYKAVGYVGMAAFAEMTLE